jgi:ubiquitin-like-conjugating enzyme ATG10
MPHLFTYISQDALVPNASGAISSEDNSDAPPGYSTEPQQPFVVYDIIYHDTYTVPTLWFSLHHLPNGDSAFDHEVAYRYLVPDHMKGGLRDVGYTSAGGISAAVGRLLYSLASINCIVKQTDLSMQPHPITSVPSFFIHPCNTPEAMRLFQNSTTRENYLMVWLGIVGSLVGLHVPVAMGGNPTAVY